MEWFLDFASQNSEALFGLVGVLVGTVTGFWLSTQKDNYLRKRRCSSHWGALSAEAEICREQAESFLKEPYKAPLYRFPGTSYLSSFPRLLEDGDITKSEVRVIVKFFTEVETLNRGLDLAQDARGSKLLSQEDRRNRKKAGRLTATGTRYRDIRAVLSGKLQQA